MEQQEFEQTVIRAVESLPRRIQAKIRNVVMCVEDWPSADQLSRAGTRYGHTLLGLYEGIPQTVWGKDLTVRLPDKITIFRGPILSIARTPEELEILIKSVVWHEVGHYFGFNENRIRKLEIGWRQKQKHELKEQASMQ